VIVRFVVLCCVANEGSWRGQLDFCYEYFVDEIVTVSKWRDCHWSCAAVQLKMCCAAVQLKVCCAAVQLKVCCGAVQLKLSCGTVQLKVC